MSTLLLRLEGPMQSWGIQSRYGRRDTGLEPSKSGVIGLLCAAMGRPRDADLSDVAALRMGVRVDRSGAVESDYHTAGAKDALLPNYGVAAFGTKVGETTGTVLSTRFYLADASFLVGLEASTPDQETLLARVNDALARPVWPLFLGRKAFVPAAQIRLRDGLRPEPLEEALRTYPWLTARDGEQHWREPARVRLVIEERQSTGESRMDVPVSFQPLDRRYQSRYVRTMFIDRPPDAPSPEHSTDAEE